MRVRAGILVAVLALALTACGGGDGDDKKPSAAGTRLGTPSKPVTETTLDCDKYSDTAKKIVEAQQDLFTASGDTSEALDALNAELDAIKEGAPRDVKAAVDELEAAFEKVQEAMSNPTSEAQSELADLAPKLSADGQKITAYIVSKCN